MSIATRTGDDGTTGLMFGRRVSKTHPRVEACGCVDELNVALGLVRALAGGVGETNNQLLQTQQELIGLMGELGVQATDLPRYQSAGYARLEAASLQRLDELITTLEASATLSYDGWATPGANLLSAHWDFARTTCRRAERAVIRLQEGGGAVPPLIIHYLNRLSDLCWLQARAAEPPKS